jgi:hypothetical protein
MALTLGMQSVVLRQERLVELDILVAWFTSFYFKLQGLFIIKDKFMPVFYPFL